MILNNIQAFGRGRAELQSSGKQRAAVRLSESTIKLEPQNRVESQE